MKNVAKKYHRENEKLNLKFNFCPQTTFIWREKLNDKENFATLLIPLKLFDYLPKI